MTGTTMTLDHFRVLLETHGAEASRWPDGVGDAAVILLARSPEARAVLDRAKALERLLDLADGPAVSADRVDRVVTAALAALPERRSVWTALADLLRSTATGLWPQAAGLAVCALAGIVVGLTAPRSVSSAGMTSSIAAAASAATVEQRGVAVAAFAPSTIESLFE
ncbi:hypothetical protein [Oleisolibacter albus]|uniref:hypothetical protein n=1 Tax=Oleisolibacter albus TaxID=2171757 RepID=UPI0012D760F4|nr:hypothetical protein [Oleisolibacter albus]